MNRRMRLLLALALVAVLLMALTASASAHHAWSYCWTYHHANFWACNTLWTHGYYGPALPPGAY